MHVAAAWMHVATAWTHMPTCSPGAYAHAHVHVQVKPDTVMIELDASRAGKLIAKKPSAGTGAEAGAGAGAGAGGGGGAAGDEAGRAPPSSIGRLAGRVLRGKVDLQEAKADAVGVGLSSMYKQLDQMGFQVST